MAKIWFFKFGDVLGICHNRMEDVIVSLNTQTHTYTAPTHALMHVYPHMKESPCVLSVVNMMLS